METITVKDLRKITKDLPEDMPINLLDITTDNIFDCSYSLYETDFSVDNYCNKDEEIVGKCLWIAFENNRDIALNETGDLLLSILLKTTITNLEKTEDGYEISFIVGKETINMASQELLYLLRDVFAHIN